MVELPYGRAPLRLDLGGRAATLVRAPTMPAPPALAPLLDAALDAPFGAPLSARIRAGERATIIVSDATRPEPRGAFLDAIAARIGAARLTIAVATGTHGPANLDELGLPAWARASTIVNHDGHRADDLVEVGTTARGTPVRVHRCAVEADLVVATGCIKPHYFAGFGAGAKAIFPGLGEATAIRTNHVMKTDRGARAGVLDGNPCREDLDEAVRIVGTPVFLCNGVVGPDGAIHAVVAGELEPAFRAGAGQARAWFTVGAPRAPIVIASDALPVSASLYQAAKIAAAVSPLVEAGGALVLVAECADGVGPLATVNEAIFRIGVLPRLAPDVSLHLVSGLPREEVARTLLAHATDVRGIIDAHPGRILVIPNASQLIFEATS